MSHLEAIRCKRQDATHKVESKLGRRLHVFGISLQQHLQSAAKSSQLERCALQVLNPYASASFRCLMSINVFFPSPRPIYATCKGVRSHFAGPCNANSWPHHCCHQWAQLRLQGPKPCQLPLGWLLPNLAWFAATSPKSPNHSSQQTNVSTCFLLKYA